MPRRPAVPCPMAEILWHPHSGRNPRNVSKTRFFPNKDASKRLHTEARTTSQEERFRSKTMQPGSAATVNPATKGTRARASHRRLFSSLAKPPALSVSATSGPQCISRVFSSLPTILQALCLGYLFSSLGATPIRLHPYQSPCPHAHSPLPVNQCNAHQNRAPLLSV